MMSPFGGTLKARGYPWSMANTPKLIRRLRARLQAQATDVLGSKEKAIDWMKAPNGALGGATPISVLDTETKLGARAAEDVLARIEFGVFS
jgi:putative toxin-antitoxin system antitoxin component (TIGR02293 family)